MRNKIKSSTVWKRFKCLVDGHAMVQHTNTVEAPSLVAGNVFKMHECDRLTFIVLSTNGISAVVLDHMQCLICGHATRIA